MVGEEYSIQNNSNPPAAYFKQDGNFEFTIPQGAELDQVSTFGPSGMPVRQGTIDKGKGRYAICLCISAGTKRRAHFLHRAVHRQPGADSRILHLRRAARSARDSADHADFQRGIQRRGHRAGFQRIFKRIHEGRELDLMFLCREPRRLRADASASSGAPDQVNGRDSGGRTTTIETAPARLGDEKWILLGGLAAIFAVGVGLLLRKPVPERRDRARRRRQLAKSRKARKAQRSKGARKRGGCSARAASRREDHAGSELESGLA